MLGYVVFVNEIKQYNYDHFPCVYLSEFFSTTLGDDLWKMPITAKIIILKKVSAKLVC